MRVYFKFDVKIKSNLWSIFSEIEIKSCEVRMPSLLCLTQTMPNFRGLYWLAYPVSFELASCDFATIINNDYYFINKCHSLFI